MTTRVIIHKTILYFVLVVISIMTVFPLLWGLSASFRSDDEFFRYTIPFSSKTLLPQVFTLGAYERLFFRMNFARPIMNTLFVTGVTIFLGSIVNSLAAFSFATFDFKFKKIIYAIVMVSFMIPFEAIVMPLYMLVLRLRWVNTYYGLIVPTIADGLVLFLFTQFFRDIPKSLIEAARVDGAGWLTIFIRIIIVPSSVTVFITAGLMTFMGHWNSYFWPLLVARSRDIRMVQTALADTRTEHVTLWSVLYAGSMVAAFIPLFLFFPLQKYFVQGYIGSGIKG